MDILSPSIIGADREADSTQPIRSREDSPNFDLPHFSLPGVATNSALALLEVASGLYPTLYEAADPHSLKSPQAQYLFRDHALQRLMPLCSTQSMYPIQADAQGVPHFVDGCIS